MDFKVSFDKSRGFELSIMGAKTGLACDNFWEALERLEDGATGNFIFSVCWAPDEEKAPGGLVALVLKAYDGEETVTPVLEVISKDGQKTKPLSPNRWKDICVESGELDEETVSLIVDVITSEQGRETLSCEFEEIIAHYKDTPTFLA